MPPARRASKWRARRAALNTHPAMAGVGRARDAWQLATSIRPRLQRGSAYTASEVPPRDATARCLNCLACTNRAAGKCFTPASGDALPT